MKKYKISIEEDLIQEFELEAENEKDAGELAKSRYYLGEYILGNATVHRKYLAVTEDGKDYSESYEF